MIYHGKTLDPISLWSALGVTFGQLESPLPTFTPKSKCPNPDHDTSKRHFQVNTRQPTVHCFADCGISGSFDHAVCVVLGIYAKRGITDAAIKLARSQRKPRESVETGQAREVVAAAHKEARKVILGHTRVALGTDIVSAFKGNGLRKTLGADSYVANDEERLNGGAFSFLPEPVRSYLDRRGIDTSARGKWQLGWCEDEERLIIPAYDERGTFRFLIKRQISGSGSLKYLYTPGTVKTSLLFGACVVDREQVRSHGLVLCEGSLDVIRLHQMGVKNAVAILGTGLSTQQVRLIDRMNARRIYLLFDKDAAGAKNVLDAEARLTKVPLRVCRYPSHRSDPAELTKQEVEAMLAKALPMTEFLAKTRTTRLKELV